MFKLIVKVLIPLFTAVYKLTGGLIGGKLGPLPVLLLSTTGRKSGKERTVPVAYLQEGDSYVVIASFAGQPKHPAWFHNLKNNPNASVQIGRSQTSVKAEIADPEKKKVLWEKLLKIAPNFEEYQKRTTRDIPVVILHPVS
jgi:deazaflavin-dependent oxidoreductase (nitroreductase family)